MCSPCLPYISLLHCHHIFFQVKDIPKNHRLGCVVRIPNTSFKQVVRAEDDFLVDNLSMFFLTVCLINHLPVHTYT